MLPSPKKVARILRRYVFRSNEEKEIEEEIKRDTVVRKGKARIQNHINHQNEMAGKLKILAKKALSLNDNSRFTLIGKQYIKTKLDIQRWEKYLLSLEVLEAKRDQVSASINLIQSVKTMSESLGDIVGDQKIGELQVELETGLARASNLDERIDVMMEILDSSLSYDIEIDQSLMDDFKSSIIEEISTEEDNTFTQEIEERLLKIQDEIKEEKTSP